MNEDKDELIQEFLDNDLDIDVSSFSKDVDEYKRLYSLLASDKSLLNIKDDYNLNKKIKIVKSKVSFLDYAVVIGALLFLLSIGIMINMAF